MPYRDISEFLKIDEVRSHSDEIQQYLGKIEAGQDFVGDVEWHLKKIRELFELAEDQADEFASMENLKREVRDAILDEQRGRLAPEEVEWLEESKRELQRYYGDKVWD